MRTIVRSTNIYTGDLDTAHPKFPKGSEAACATSTNANGVASDSKYSVGDDNAIEKFLRKNIGSCWHSLGTAKMAPHEKISVVDSELNVYAVRGLKYVDLSIVPALVAANNNNTALIVVENGLILSCGSSACEIRRGSEMAADAMNERRFLQVQRSCY